MSLPTDPTVEYSVPIVSFYCMHCTENNSKQLLLFCYTYNLNCDCTTVGVYCTVCMEGSGHVCLVLCDIIVFIYWIIWHCIYRETTHESFHPKTGQLRVDYMDVK